MRTVAVCVVSILLAAPALAQQAAPAAASRTMVSASEVQAMIAKAKADRKDDQALVAQSLIQLAPYNVSLE
jgi:hypothetical protein